MTAPAVPPAPAAAFHAVIQHDDSEEEAHRPVRRRRRAGEAETPQPASLQLVETQVETPPPVVEDELPRRTKPRRRRSAPSESGPLKLVETGGEAPTRSDTPPA